MLNKLLNIKDASSEIDKLTAELETVENEAAEKVEKMQALEAELQNQNEALEAALAKVKDLEAEAETVEEAAAAQAAEVVACLGVDEAATATAADEKTEEELWAEYHNETDPKAKNAFYKTHRERLFKS